MFPSWTFVTAAPPWPINNQFSVCCPPPGMIPFTWAGVFSQCSPSFLFLNNYKVSSTFEQKMATWLQTSWLINPHIPSQVFQGFLVLSVHWVQNRNLEDMPCQTRRDMDAELAALTPEWLFPSVCQTTACHSWHFKLGQASSGTVFNQSVLHARWAGGQKVRISLLFLLVDYD